MGSFHHRILKKLRQGGKLQQESGNQIKLYDGDGNFDTIVKEKFLADLKDYIKLAPCLDPNYRIWLINDESTEPNRFSFADDPIILTVAGIQIKITPVDNTYAVDEIKIPGVVLSGAESLSDAIKLVGDHIKHHSANLLNGLR